jgi:hypothetical protein
MDRRWPFSWEIHIMNTYEVTYADGKVVEIEAWMPEIAHAIAEEDAEFAGTPGLAIVSIKLLTPQPADG